MSGAEATECKDILAGAAGAGAWRRGVLRGVEEAVGRANPCQSTVEMKMYSPPRVMSNAGKNAC